jgi:hypothetical protein
VGEATGRNLPGLMYGIVPTISFSRSRSVHFVDAPKSQICAVNAIDQRE